MINNISFSTIITSHKSRFNTLDSVINSWLTQPIEELWVIDDGNKFQTNIKDQRLLIFNMPKDFETKSDYSLATLTSGDVIILADDDIVVKKNFVLDLYRGLKQTNNSIVGVIGYNGKRLQRAWRLKVPAKVFWVGMIIMSLRENFGFDTKGMHKNCDDLWFSMKIHSDINKYVIPTTNYTNLSCCRGETALSSKKNLKRIRQSFFNRYVNT